MSRRDDDGQSSGMSEERLSSRCATPTGASPVPASAEAPGSRPQSAGEILKTTAGCRKPNRGEALERERERGPQHEVNPAASTDSQRGSRADHVAAKATTNALDSERAADPSGVGGAARVQGVARNTRDPSASPSSRQVASYRPKAKSIDVQRESEGIVVPTMVATNNAIGGKDRKSTRLNSSHTVISYAVFCLKKKKKI